MRTMQLVGPFVSGQEYGITINGTICQMGFEIGDNIPFAYSENMLEPIFKVNNISYTINDTCILEWGDIAMRYIAVTPLKDLDEYTIIDVAYE